MAKRELVLILGTALSLAAAREAHAWMQYCNGTNVTIWTTYNHYDSGCRNFDRRLGWWRLDPGQCKIVDGARLQYPQRAHWARYYAEGGGLSWGGVSTLKFCTPYAAFNYCAGDACSGPSRQLYWGAVVTDYVDNFTLTFVR